MPTSTEPSTVPAYEPPALVVLGSIRELTENTDEYAAATTCGPGSTV